MHHAHASAGKVIRDLQAQNTHLHKQVDMLTKHIEEHGGHSAEHLQSVTRENARLKSQLGAADEALKAHEERHGHTQRRLQTLRERIEATARRCEHWRWSAQEQAQENAAKHKRIVFLRYALAASILTSAFAACQLWAS